MLKVHFYRLLHLADGPLKCSCYLNKALLKFRLQSEIRRCVIRSQLEAPSRSGRARLDPATIADWAQNAIHT